MVSIKAYPRTFIGGPRSWLTVMSYNITSQTHVQPGPTLSNNTSAPEWKGRKRILLEEIKIVNPTVLLMQEVDVKYANDWKSTLKQQYNMDFHFNNSKQKLHGCAIAYRRDLFDLKLVKHYSNDEPLKSYNGSISSCILMVLQHKTMGSTFIFGTTHIKPDVASKKLWDIFLFKTKVQDIASKYNYPFIVLGGDFNINEGSLEYKFMTGSMDKNSVSGSLKAAISAPKNKPQEIPDVTKFITKLQDCIENLEKSSSTTLKFSSRREISSSVEKHFTETLNLISKTIDQAKETIDQARETIDQARKTIAGIEASKNVNPTVIVTQDYAKNISNDLNKLYPLIKNMRSVYREHYGKEPLFSGRSTLDYILASKNLKLTTVLKPIPEHSLPDRLPCVHNGMCIPSDHQALAASFHL